MGLFSKIIVFALLLALAFWAFDNVKIGTMTVCVSHDSNELNVTCVADVDCVNYLTSLYGSYPDTSMYTFILSQTSSCELGKCQLRDFSFDDICSANETPVVYKVTLKESLSVDGVLN